MQRPTLRPVHRHTAVVTHAIGQRAGIPYELERKVCTACHRVLAGAPAPPHRRVVVYPVGAVFGLVPSVAWIVLVEPLRLTVSVTC